MAEAGLQYVAAFEIFVQQYWQCSTAWRYNVEYQYYLHFFTINVMGL